MAFAIDKYIGAILVFSVFVMAGLLIIVDVNYNYNTNISTTDITKDYDVVNESFYIINSQKNATLSGEISSTDSLDSMTRGVFSALRFIRDFFRIGGNIIDAVAGKMGVPLLFVQATITAIGLFVIFGIILIIFRVRSG